MVKIPRSSDSVASPISESARFPACSCKGEAGDTIVRPRLRPAAVENATRDPRQGLRDSPILGRPGFDSMQSEGIPGASAATIVRVSQEAERLCLRCCGGRCVSVGKRTQPRTPIRKPNYTARHVTPPRNEPTGFWQSVVNVSRYTDFPEYRAFPIPFLRTGACPTPVWRARGTQGFTTGRSRMPARNEPTVICNASAKRTQSRMPARNEPTVICNGSTKRTQSRMPARNEPTVICNGHRFPRTNPTASDSGRGGTQLVGRL